MQVLSLATKFVFDVESIQFIELSVIYSIIFNVGADYGLTTKDSYTPQHFHLPNTIEQGAKSPNDCLVYRSSRPTSVHIDIDNVSRLRYKPHARH